MVRTAAPEDRLLLQSIDSAALFLNHAFLVVIDRNNLAAFLAWRQLTPVECEILHLETMASFRRRGFARSLLNLLKKQQLGDVFLEVRESNTAARNLYKTEAFAAVGVRRNYYSDPSEDAIVMKFHSC